MNEDTTSLFSTATLNICECERGREGGRKGVVLTGPENEISTIKKSDGFLELSAQAKSQQKGKKRTSQPIPT